MTKYRGYVVAKLADQKLLQSYNIKLGVYDFTENIWDECIIPDTAIPLLDEHFGILMYGLLEEIEEKCK